MDFKAANVASKTSAVNADAQTNHLNHPRRYALHIDAFYNLSGTLANDVTYFEAIVRSISELAGMRLLNMTSSMIEQDLKKLDLPHFADEGGFSILGLISTSHIALHVWPARRYFMFDLVSCRAFDLAAIITHLNAILDVDKVQYSHISNAEVTDDG